MNLTDATAVYAGTTEARAVYYGSKKLWPTKYHEVLDGPTSVATADGSRGHSTFLDGGYSLSSRSLSFIGFKMAGFPTPAPRIKNGRITTAAGVYEFGVDYGWSLVGYFATSDLNITSAGIGRQGDNNLGGGWVQDVCGFYLTIPSSELRSSSQIIVDYEYTSNWANKHGVAFWSEVSGAGGGIGSDWIGTWDTSTSARLPSEIPRNTIVAQASVTSGTLYRRRIIIQNS
jgi:hypothetical protein